MSEKEKELRKALKAFGMERGLSDKKADEFVERAMEEAKDWVSKDK